MHTHPQRTHACMYTPLTASASADRVRMAGIVTGLLILTLFWPKAVLMHIHQWCVCVFVCVYRSQRVALALSTAEFIEQKQARVLKCRRAPDTGRLLWQPQSLETDKQLVCSSFTSPHAHTHAHTQTSMVAHPHATQVYNGKNVCDGESSKCSSILTRRHVSSTEVVCFNKDTFHWHHLWQKTLCRQIL